MTPKELFASAMDLSEEERAELISMLLESLDAQDDEGIEAAWLVEIERRVAELDSGVVQSIPWTELRNRVFEAGVD
ncbi:MAG: addiction module protein [Chromatiales bacterium]|nr:MAG: addiction module protein [Chromatiales bacterium]